MKKWLIINIVNNVEYVYGRYTDRKKANECALTLQENGYDVYVIEEK